MCGLRNGGFDRSFISAGGVLGGDCGLSRLRFPGSAVVYQLPHVGALNIVAVGGEQVVVVHSEVGPLVSLGRRLRKACAASAEGTEGCVGGKSNKTTSAKYTEKRRSDEMSWIEWQNGHAKDTAGVKFACAEWVEHTT